MFADQMLDSQSVRPIAFLESSGPASPYPRRARRSMPIAAALAGTVALAFAAAALTLPTRAAGPRGARRWIRCAASSGSRRATRSRPASSCRSGRRAA